MKEKFFAKSRFIIALFCFIAMSQFSFSQFIDRDPANYPDGTVFSSDCPASCSEILLPGIRVNESKTFTIPLLVSSPYTLSVTNVSGSCTAIMDNHTVSNSGNTVTVEVSEKCPSGENSSLSFTFRVEKGTDPPDEQLFTVPILRDTAKIVMVLDISGSMAMNVQGTSETRIDELKNAVNMLVPKLEELRQQGDSLAVTYFSSSVIQPDPPISDDFIAIDNTDSDYNQWSSVKVYYDMNPRTPLQMTALGEGLLDAKNKLEKDESANLKRMVFLFTDGLQNHGNKLKPDGLTFYQTDDSLNNYSANPKDSIYYFPVATWAAGDHPELLQNIVNANKGEVLFVTPNSDLQTWFDNQLSSMLDDGSPQIVMEKTAQTNSGTTNYKFDLNDMVSTLLIGINSHEELDVQIFKDNRAITLDAKEYNRDKFNMFSFHFPVRNDSTYYSKGKWRIEITGETEKKYNLSVIADDHNLEYTCFSSKNMYTVGDSLSLHAHLSYTGAPLTASNTVKAIVLKPGEDLGHLLSITETPETDTSADLSTGAADKFNELITNDSLFLHTLLPEEQIVEMTHDGEGKYSGQFTQTEKAGIYNIIFFIDGQIPGRGNFQRTKTISTIFVFGQVEEKEPEVVEDPPPPSDGHPKSYTVLRIRPVNTFGYFMGPGFASKIDIKIKKQTGDKAGNQGSLKQKTAMLPPESNSEKPELFEIKDNLDGSYLLYIANITPADRWDFEVQVRGETIHNYDSSPPLWIFIILLIMLLLLYFLRKEGKLRIIMWILLIAWIIIVILRYLGYLNFIS